MKIKVALINKFYDSYNNSESYLDIKVLPNTPDSFLNLVNSILDDRNIKLEGYRDKIENELSEVLKLSGDISNFSIETKLRKYSEQLKSDLQDLCNPKNKPYIRKIDDINSWELGNSKLSHKFKRYINNYYEIIVPALKNNYPYHWYTVIELVLDYSLEDLSAIKED